MTATLAVIHTGRAAPEWDPVTLGVLTCYLLHWLDWHDAHPDEPCPMPSSRLLRTRYTRLSRSLFGRGVRRLIADGWMHVGPDHHAQVAVPADLVTALAGVIADANRHHLRTR